jgi:SPP1 family predicted phage head-tail adaptor
MKYNKNEVTGKMRDRIILQNVNRSRSLTGFASESWADTATIWAFAESKLPGSNETIIDGKNTAKNVCDFTIRYISTITEESRVVWGDKLYQVKNLKVSHDRRFISFQGVFYDSYILRGVNVDASVNGIGTTSANLKLIMSVIGQANASASTTATITKIIEVSSLVNANALLSGDINFVQKAQASLLATGTTTADLTVNAPSASLLLDLYPDAAAAYSLRKLRTAYTGSAVRVRRSSDNTEQDIGFVSGQLDTVSLLAFCGSGNGFVTTWYDQSGSARDATQTTQASQPQIVFTGILLLQGSKPTINLNGTSNSLNMININNILSSIGHFNSFGVYYNIETNINTVYESLFSNLNARVLHQYSRVLPNKYGIGGRRLISDTFNYNESSAPSISFVLISNIIKYSSSDLFVYQNGNNVVSNLNYQTDGLSGAENTENFLFFARNTGPGQYFKGNVSEIVIYTTDKSSDRINIETNINTNYAIY